MSTTTVDTLRPDNLGTFVGQPAMKEMIVAHTETVWKTGRRLPHVLLLGPPGAGKTTIATIVADMLNMRIEVFSSQPTKDRFIETLLDLHVGIVFLDEIHELSSSFQNTALLTLLEEGYIDTNAYGRLDFPNITVIGATTEREKVNKPLRSRFTLQPRFEDYTDVELAQIVWGMSVKKGVELTWEQAEQLGRAAAGVPRQGRQLIEHAHALATSRGDWTVEDVLTMANVQADGLTLDHIDYLTCVQSQPGDVGLSTISTRLRLAEAEVRDLERLLLDRGLITLARTGRRLMPAGRRRLADGPSDA